MVPLSTVGGFVGTAHSRLKVALELMTKENRFAKIKNKKNRF
jgi:hypothetical protein